MVHCGGMLRQQRVICVLWNAARRKFVLCAGCVILVSCMVHVCHVLPCMSIGTCTNTHRAVQCLKHHSLCIPARCATVFVALLLCCAMRHKSKTSRLCVCVWSPCINMIGLSVCFQAFLASRVSLCFFLCVCWLQGIIA